VLIFSLASVVVKFFKQYRDFSLNKSCKTYLGPTLPPGGRNWQLISPHYIRKIKKGRPFKKNILFNFYRIEQKTVQALHF
jgi:hypothetical protein